MHWLFLALHAYQKIKSKNAVNKSINYAYSPPEEAKLLRLLRRYVLFCPLNEALSAESTLSCYIDIPQLRDQVECENFTDKVPY